MIRRIFSTLALCAAGFCVASAQEAPVVPDILEQKGYLSDEFAPMFPFQPTHNTPNNITNVRTWPGVSNKVAGADGFISVEGDHFVDGNGKPIRFVGTQLGMTGQFPDHENAEKIAKALSRYGVTIVRMHYVSHRIPKEGYPVKDSFIEPVQLERFDYFFAKLKEQGIYMYFQLNIARKVSSVNGFVTPNFLPKYKNGIDNLNYDMIRLQKSFHKEFLEHVNPYTGICYRDDSAISMMELANENSIVFAWWNPEHKFPNLIEPYKSQVISMWNQWLIDKYGDTKRLKATWGDGSLAIPVIDEVKNQDPDKTWNVQISPTVRATLDDLKFAKGEVTDRGNKFQGKMFTRMIVEKSSPDKALPKMYWMGFGVEQNKAYCIKFKMRTAQPTPVTIRIGQRNEPWLAAGLQVDLKATEKWKEYRVDFVATLTDNDVRLTFSNIGTGNSLDVADLTLTKGFDYNFPVNQSLENENVDWPYVWNRYVPMQRALDFAEFLAEKENLYFTDLYTNIKNNVGVRQPVAGTQLGYGYNVPMAAMDYCDIHDYWCHPGFAGRKWDWNYWNLRNGAIVNPSAGTPGMTFSQMARTRIFGKPFTVSEYDHPNLNLYCAEGDLMLSAVGAFQDWSAVIQFSWILNTDYDRSYVYGMFDMCSAPQKLVHFPACYSMFVRGDVKKGDNSVVFALPSSYERDILANVIAANSRGHREIKDATLKAMSLALPSGRQMSERPDLFDKTGKYVIESPQDIPDSLRRAFNRKHLVNSTGELTWDWTRPGEGWFSVNTAKTKAFTGFTSGRSFKFKGLTLTPGKNRLNWCTITLTQASADGPAPKDADVLAPGSYLLAATGLVLNTGQKTVEPKGMPGKLSTSPADGGVVGTGPILCEGISASLVFNGLQGKVKCYALDTDGARMAEVKTCPAAGNNIEVKIAPEYKTIWYELVVSR